MTTEDTIPAPTRRHSVLDPRPRWWRRPWILPLAVVAVLFVAFSLPRYLTFDPALSRVQQPTVALHYPVLVAHVIFGSIAMLTCCLQVWPRLRRKYPAAHRMVGRAYVFVGVVPAGVAALVLGATTPFGPVAMASNLMLAVLWLGCTVIGFRAARQHRYADHRRWMIRSFALTLSIITNRVWAVLVFIALEPQLDTTFGGNEALLRQAVGGTVAWLSWTVPLLAVQWWLERDFRRARPAAKFLAVPEREGKSG
ncbi:DUF2306 domain-containing protein [Nocardia sp. NBC_00508]|uniref:DUF2306 domain-containing protein n=1 Tax=Nocardia sp. NBC_00508 TaxID=2975992 RepID=UPI002E81C773|nr:DUF2306 domain-containing protein [Nocardia sp. NBC_00508]WUD66095.1 DUF2306 domain-containing protein [Nocardia sp. NBC_00508]